MSISDLVQQFLNLVDPEKNYLLEQKVAPEEAVLVLKDTKNFLSQDLDLSSEQLRSFSRLMKRLEQKDVDRLELAKVVSSWVDSLSLESSETQVRDRLKVFIERSRSLQSVLEETRKQASAMSPENILEHNREVFSFAGLVYIFEYTAILYLLFKQADPEKRKTLLNSEKVQLPGFTAPGIRAGAENDKTLTEFILRIYDQNIRGELIKKYLVFRKGLLMAQDDQKALKALRSFLLDFIPYFERYDIKEFSGFMPEEFGIQTIGELKKNLIKAV